MHSVPPLPINGAVMSHIRNKTKRKNKIENRWNCGKCLKTTLQNEENVKITKQQRKPKQGPNNRVYMFVWTSLNAKKKSNFPLFSKNKVNYFWAAINLSLERNGFRFFSSFFFCVYSTKQEHLQFDWIRKIEKHNNSMNFQDELCTEFIWVAFWMPTQGKSKIENCNDLMRCQLPVQNCQFQKNERQQNQQTQIKIER